LTNAQKNDVVYYAEADLKYQLKVKNSGIPIISKRGVVNATEKKTALTKSIAKTSNRS
jgi:hypothetical protein